MKKLIFMISFIAIITGCTMVTQNTTNNDLPVSSNNQQIANLTFEDLPVPSKMILDRDNSFVYETANYRTGILFYSGNMNAVDVANFYKSEMSKYNWTLVNSLEYKKGSQLIFEKPGWIVVVRIESNWENSSKLTITIGPKGSQEEPTK
jgi:hypothetical protein